MAGKKYILIALFYSLSFRSLLKKFIFEINNKVSQLNSTQGSIWSPHSVVSSLVILPPFDYTSLPHLYQLLVRFATPQDFMKQLILYQNSIKCLPLAHTRALQTQFASNYC